MKQETFHQEVMQHGAVLLERLRQMSDGELFALLLEVEHHNHSEPLRLKRAPQITEGTWDSSQKQTGV
jgi:hypothetical protein